MSNLLSGPMEKALLGLSLGITPQPKGTMDALSTRGLVYTSPIGPPRLTRQGEICLAYIRLSKDLGATVNEVASMAVEAGADVLLPEQ